MEKKLRELTAQKTGIPFDDVDQVIDFQWKYLYKNTKDGNKHLYLPTLGSFKIRQKPLQEQIEKYQRLIQWCMEEIDKCPDNFKRIRSLTISIDKYQENLDELLKKKT